MKISKLIYLTIILFGITQNGFSQSQEYQLKKEQKLAQKSPFEKIWDGELPANVVYKDEEIIAFTPLGGQAPVHYLIVPRKRIPTINDLTEEDAHLIGKMFIVARDLAKKYGIDESGYRLAMNNNEDSGQSVFHIHLHLLGGMKTGPMVDQTYRNTKRKEE